MVTALLDSAAISGCRDGGRDGMGGGWLFGQFRDGSTDPDFDEADLEPVEFPHCVTDLSWWRWDPNSWNRMWIYRHHLRAGRQAAGEHGQRIIIRLDGVLTGATLFLNGQRIGEHLGGYLPFEYELTGRLRSGDNVLAVVVDSRWGLNVPPDQSLPSRPKAIDFYQPGGISREVKISTLPAVFIRDLFALPLDVLTSQPRLAVRGVLDARSGAPPGPQRITVRLLWESAVVAEQTTPLLPSTAGRKPFEIVLNGLPAVQLWSLDRPVLYSVEASVRSPQGTEHTATTRIGFREARFERRAFLLNGERVHLFGLNRHQWFPYVGAAMPDRVQRRDAEILKNELNCTMVRCSHYPQSEAFLDACDELGLLVWEEAPGWDYIGDRVWRGRVLRDVHDMVLRDRNHPSIIAWGTRLNETEDDVDLYSRTRAIAESLDGSRATTGAVNSSVVGGGPVIPSQFRDPFATTPLVQDVFAFNDYLRPAQGQLPSLRKPRTDLPYLVSEAVGTLVGPKSFRRTDSAEVQARQALLHAAVHDQAMGDDHYCGLLAWCAFDYPSGFHNSVDGMKWPGVLDTFREPKLGAAFYRAQVDPAVRPVIEPAFYWDVGSSSQPQGPGSGAMIWSNCEQLAVWVGNQQIPVRPPDRVRFPNLRYPPFVVDFPVFGAPAPDLRIDGFVAGQRLLSRCFSADRTGDTLAMRADDTLLRADGSDATRVSLRVVDRYGTPHGFAGGKVSFILDGPGDLVGNNPLDLSGNGGVGAVWVRTRRERPGRLAVHAHHATLGWQSVSIDIV